MAIITEDDIEQEAVQILKELGYRHLNCFTAERDQISDGSGRESKKDVILREILQSQTRKLNPDLPQKALDSAIAELTKKRSSMALLKANQEVYGYLRDGIQVDYTNDEGREIPVRVKFMDFNTPANNDFLAVTQLWIQGERNHRRPDILLYVNGLPLVFIELKNANVKLRQAFDKNLTDYKQDIPQLFTCNAFCVLSNALETKVGSFSAQWEHFFKWLRADDEKEPVNTKAVKAEGSSLKRLLHGLCPQERLLDYLENFILFHKDEAKIIAQNHQFIGVNRAVESFGMRHEKAGRLGVFWHTQGSGKSFSMIFLARKIFRKFQGDFTFLIVTDREDLDSQIYRNFVNTGTVKESEAAQPANGSQLRDFLSQNKRTVFTLIQKFRYDKGKSYPILYDATQSQREIIVIVDEAHRTQYKSLAENMRAGLPGAHYFAFTGTPLLGAGRKTSQWFGDYVSEYNFTQAIDDESTVPLFYEKRVPEVLIANDDLNDEFYEILEDENLDEIQQEKLEREFARELHVIKRDDRLEKIANDIAYHFPRRGYLGKGMMIAIDKFTAVKMYDKVQKCWKDEIKALRQQQTQAKSETEKARIKAQLDYMKSVEMAVVISESAGEEDVFSDQGLDITPHRKKLASLDAHGHDIEYRFKDPKDPLQLVFVCAMWLTGFDAPTVSTLYLDKPMKDHTLMQTIARANRVTSYQIQGVSKTNGEIIDYYNVFRNMKKALAAYALGDQPQDKAPVQDKEALFEILDEALHEAQSYLKELGIEIKQALEPESTLKKIELYQAFANRLFEKDEWRQQFKVYENTLSSLYEACKPEILEQERRPMVQVFEYLRKVMDSIVQEQNIDVARARLAELLDESVQIVRDQPSLSLNDPPAVYQVNAPIQVSTTLNLGNLAEVNFEKLRANFKQANYKNLEITNLRAFLDQKLNKMMEQNRSRIHFAQKFQEIIDTYNAGGSSTENYFEDLVNFAEGLKDEDERHVREELTPEELELFDILRKEKLTAAEEQKVKLAAKQLLERLIASHPKVLVLDWYKDSQTQRKVKSVIEDVLDENLPESYDRKTYNSKCDAVFNLVLDYSEQHKKWAL